MSLIFFEFGTLVGGYGVFKRQRVQSQFVAQTGDGRAVGRLQFDPDEAVRLADMIADVVEINGLDGGVLKELAVDDGT